jgi:hypothetical protein
MDDADKNLLMYFSTSLRNIGLFTSVSLGALGYSRFYRSKNAIHNIYLILVSLFFLLASMYIAYYLVQDIETFNNDETNKIMEKWILLPKGLIIVNGGMFAIGVYTLICELGRAMM